MNVSGTAAMSQTRFTASSMAANASSGDPGRRDALIDCSGSWRGRGYVLQVEWMQARDKGDPSIHWQLRHFP